MKSTIQTITIVLAALLICFAGCKNSNEEKMYTVEFIDNGDTTYLFNREPLFLKDAESIARSFVKQKEGRQAKPISFLSIHPPVNPRDYQIELTNDSIKVFDGDRFVGSAKWEEKATALDSIFLNDNL